MKKGFTLFELLAVIIVLGVLGLIAIISVDKDIKNTKEQAYNTQIESIITGARTWAGKHVFTLPENEGEYLIITLGELKQSGDVEKEIINPKTKEPFDDNMEIKITRQNNDYVYEINE